MGVRTKEDQNPAEKPANTLCSVRWIELVVDIVESNVLLPEQ